MKTPPVRPVIFAYVLAFVVSCTAPASAADPLDGALEVPLLARLAQTTTAAAAAAPAPEDGAGEAGSADLAKQLANPVADLISLPLQSNFDFNVGPDDDGFRYTLNVQPVIPFGLNEDWNVITRTIVPFISQDDVVGDGSETGLGDILASQFFSPRDSAGVIWGVGPVFLLPTATEDELGAEKWGAGPTAVALRQEGPWTFGFLGNHVWSFAGDDDRADVNQTFVQPFVTYTFPRGFGLILNTESTYDWTGAEWTVPIFGGVSQVMKLGNQPLSLQLGARVWADGPDAAPEWGIRFNVVFLFPKKMG
jgi:hypothetical protein